MANNHTTNINGFDFVKNSGTFALLIYLSDVINFFFQLFFHMLNCSMFWFSIWLADISTWNLHCTKTKEFVRHIQDRVQSLISKSKTIEPQKLRAFKMNWKAYIGIANLIDIRWWFWIEIERIILFASFPIVLIRMQKMCWKNILPDQRDQMHANFDGLDNRNGKPYTFK